jgi:type I restriction enzyme R subunit
MSSGRDLIRNEHSVSAIMKRGMIAEADTCRKYVLPKLIEADWDNDPHSFTEQKMFTDGRIVMAGGASSQAKVKRRSLKRADYLLR